MTLLICLILTSGCVAKFGGTETKNNHIFVGDAPVSNAVQVATNKPIEVISQSVDADGRPNSTPNHELRDCGQFVLIPPHIYRQMRVDLFDYKQLLKEQKSK